MTEARKPHTELVAAIETGIRSTGDTNIGDAARYQARAALRELVEQYEGVSASAIGYRADRDRLRGLVDAGRAREQKLEEKLEAAQKERWSETVEMLFQINDIFTWPPGVLDD